MQNKVSVVIVTRNRTNDLQHCLGSLAVQSWPLDELIVVDNNSTDSTKLVVDHFKESIRFSVRYIKHTAIGYPHVYNRGITEATGNFVAFIDDDCIADCHWFSRIKAITSTCPKIAALLGNSREYYSNSFVALSKAYIDDVGKIGAIKNKLVTDLEILDSKNIVYNKTFLQKHKISFDVDLLNYAQGASEDCDLGMQIYMAGGIAVYDEKLKVLHKDPTDLLAYFKKLKFTLFNHLVYEQKWKLIRGRIHTKRKLFEKIRLLFRYKRKYCLSFMSFFLLVTNIFISFGLIKILRKAFSSTVKSMNIFQV